MFIYKYHEFIHVKHSTSVSNAEDMEENHVTAKCNTILPVLNIRSSFCFRIGKRKLEV